MTMNGYRCWRFPSILKAVGTSLQPGRLIIGLLVVTVLVFGGQIWDAAVPGTVSPRGLSDGVFVEHTLDAEGQLRRAVRRWGVTDLASEDNTPTAAAALAILSKAKARSIAEGESDQVKTISRTMQQIDSIRPRGAFEASVDMLSQNFDQFLKGISRVSPGVIYGAVRDTVYGVPSSLWRAEQCWFLCVYGLFFTLIIGVGGGALSRMEACQISAEERLTMREAMQHAIDHWWSFWMALVIPLLLAGLVCGILLLIGLVGMNLPVLNILTGLLYGLALLIGFLLVFLLFGYTVGWVLLVPAVAVEHCDGGDSMQRTWAYMLNKPLHMVGYLAVGLVGLALGLLVVDTVAIATVQWTAEVVGAATFNDLFTEVGQVDAVFEDPSPDSSEGSSAWSTVWAAGLVSIWTMVVWYLVAGWMVSYVMAASTRIYLLMRLAADGQNEQLIWWPGLIPGTLAEQPDSMKPLDQ